MEQLRGPRGTVVQGYLGEAAGSVAPDAVLLHGPARWTGLSARSWHLGRIPACDFRDRADVVVTPVPATRRRPGHRAAATRGPGLPATPAGPCR